MADPAQPSAQTVLEWKVKSLKAMLQVFYLTGNASWLACILLMAAFLGCCILNNEFDAKCSFPINAACVVLEAFTQSIGRAVTLQFSASQRRLLGFCRNSCLQLHHLD